MDEKIYTLADKWVFWEGYKLEAADPASKARTREEDEFTFNHQKIFTFDTLNAFAALWHATQANEILYYFTQPDGNPREFEIEHDNKKQWRRIDSMSIFRDGIYPKWEDPVNKDGSDLNFVYQRNGKTNQSNRQDFIVTTQEILNSLWYNMVSSVISEETDQHKHIAGLRINDKSEESFGSAFKVRFEVWLKINSDTPQNQEAIKLLVEHFNTVVERVFREQNMQLNPDQKFIPRERNSQKRKSDQDWQQAQGYNPKKVVY